jgi:hypothetical protein
MEPNYLPVILASEMRILPYSHDRGETKSPLVKGLAEIGPEHACEDSFVDCPEQLLAGCVVDERP